MKRETLTLAAPEVRFAADDSGTFSGYAAVFGELVASHNEMVKSGAFTRSLAETRGQPPAMFWNHNPDEPIGVWTDLTEDARGLKVAGRIVTDTSRGRDVQALLKAGAVTGLSIGFKARREERGAKGVRILTDVDLVEISLTSLPAARNARVTQVRHAAAPAETANFIQAVRRAATALTR